jgi:hypothetical protein
LNKKFDKDNVRVLLFNRIGISSIKNNVSLDI